MDVLWNFEAKDKVHDMKGFTLVELMVVVLMVAILAAAALPIYRGRVDAARWAEGKAIMGAIGTALRVHVTLEGADFDAVPTLDQLGTTPSLLGGNYFNGGESGVGDFSWVINDDQPVDFLITATAPPTITAPSKITVNALGQWTVTP